MCWGIWCCHVDHALLESSSWCGFRKFLHSIFRSLHQVLEIYVLIIEENYLTWQISWKFCHTLTLFRMRGATGGGGAVGKAHPTSFFPVTSTTVGVRPQSFLTFSFNRFATILKYFKFISSASPRLLNLHLDHSSKIAVFLVKSL